MGIHFVLLLGLLQSCLSVTDDFNFEGRISRYEIIRLNKRISKRASMFSPDEPHSSEHISFSAFGREFELVDLVPGLSVTHPSLEVVTVNGNVTEKLELDMTQFYTGRLKGDNKAEVFFSHDNGKGVIGRIDLRDESLFLEPAAAHRKNSPVQPHEDDEILIYKASDVIRDLSGSLKVDMSDDVYKKGPIPSFGNIYDEIRRIKRSFEEDEEIKDTKLSRCPIKLISDFTFFEKIGNRNVPYTARYLISMIERVNKIFMKVDFGIDSRGERMVNMGLMVKNIRIHRTPSLSPLYNGEQTKNVDSRAILDSLANFEANRDYCLVHLVTAKILAEGVLGIAYPGQMFAENELEGQIPGICGGTEYCDSLDYGHCLNAALTSVVGMYGEPLSTRESDLVMAHEFGHNFGAKHDIDDPNCVPGARKGGTYLMHPTAVRGYDPNNYMFSPCSIYSMNLVMKRNAHKCFTAPVVSYCGNGVVEPDEQCDAGIAVVDWEQQDKCCTLLCKFRYEEDNPLTCSTLNSPCCNDDCKVTNSSVFCHDGVPDRCIAPTKCTGISAECPKLESMPDESECYDRGVCRDGDCRSFCERFGLEPCLCENEAQACLRCCRESADSSCKPHVSRELMLNGSRCFYGTCNQGYCVRSTTDFVDYVKQIFKDPTAVVELMKKNWVLITVFFSFLWIPYCHIRHRRDEEQRRRRRKRAAAERTEQSAEGAVRSDGLSLG